MSAFAQQLITWQAVHGRHDLPWQGTRDPYRIWLSEIMLQQTQVATVIPFYLRFLQDFPDVRALAQADQDHVLARWSGLGYYSRARNLHAAARRIVHDHDGDFPSDVETLQTLPGIGRSTAAAIAAFAFGARVAILDGNVKRVLTRYFGIEGYPGDRRVEQDLWRRATQLLPRQDIEQYTQALMDFGATLCTPSKPRCADCPVRSQCVALRDGRVQNLPTPKPRMALPERETVMLVLRHADKVLLEKRPARGIWGGLWSFPEVGRDDRLADYLQTRFATHALSANPLPSLRHSFTHFRLDIAALQVQLAHPGKAPTAQWWDLAQAREAGLPAPVRRLLSYLD